MKQEVENKSDDHQPVFPSDLVKVVKKFDATPDKILPENRYKVAGVMMPTVSEVIYDYNPYYHGAKYCLKCAKGLALKGNEALRWVSSGFSFSMSTY